MSKTISTSGNPPDIDGYIADGLESLRQRIRSAYKFRIGEWFMSPGEGLPYDLIFTHHTNFDVASQILADVIREEGKEEILEITNITYNYDQSDRSFNFQCHVSTIYGELVVNERVLT